MQSSGAAWISAAPIPPLQIPLPQPTAQLPGTSKPAPVEKRGNEA